MDRKGYSVRWYAIVPATLAGVAVAVPVLMARAPEIGFALQRGFALVCNQRPERSFLLFGGSVAVCARCLGIYLGAAVGLLLRVSRKVALRCLLAAVALTLADWLAELCGLHGNWMLARSALGFMLGATAAGLVMASINNVKIPTPAKAA